MRYPERKIKKALTFVLQEAALLFSIVRIFGDIIPEGNSLKCFKIKC